MEPAGDPGHNGGGRKTRRRVGQRNGRGQAPLLRGGRGPRLRGVEERGRGQGHGPRQRQQQHRVPNEIRAIVVDHVMNHGMTMTEAATVIQSNLRRSTVASILRTFRNENQIVTRPNSGGRGKILTDQQEQAVVDLVGARNDIRLTEIHIKQLYRVPFKRNADRVKQMRTDYVQRVMELDADDDHHKFIYLNEAGFNLAKTKRRGRNFIGQRATIQVPGQRGANITMCAVISEDSVVDQTSCWTI
ncbi:uncharacterized protein LOC119915361 [Micropterus salmoides]|uniref:uncharacterized protein LOC119915361 n=1 Tax=Micropterus salmoides TaxID=27706 RepID=UPI0018ED9343|nr:uncharacterized protein LOC119915361 [Micropterus salmoides]